MFAPIHNRNNEIIAFEVFVNSYRIVYGTKYLKRSDLRDFFPQYQFCFVKQVHGIIIVKASAQKFIEADAHWTNEQHQALVIQTADCIPLFLIRNELACAIHAGWRGVYKKIIPHVFKELPSLNNSHLLVSVGPHILKNNFVVDKDVANKLSFSSKNASQFIEKNENEKYHISLLDIVKDQINSMTKTSDWNLLDTDTFSSDLYYSFRKRTNKEVLGQLSFIVKIKD